MNIYIAEELDSDNCGVGDNFVIQAMNESQAQAILQCHLVNKGWTDAQAKEIVESMAFEVRHILTSGNV